MIHIVLNRGKKKIIIFFIWKRGDFYWMTTLFAKKDLLISVVHCSIYKYDELLR